MTQTPDADPAWLRDFPWLGGVPPQWAREGAATGPAAAGPAPEPTLIQGRVDIGTGGIPVAVADETVRQAAPPPPAAPAAARPSRRARSGRRGQDADSYNPYVPAPRTGPSAPAASHGREPRRVPTTSTPPTRYAGIAARPGLIQVWTEPTRTWTLSRPALSRHALAGVLVLAAFAGGAEVILLWWLQTPTIRLQHLADDYIMLAQMSGLLGGYLLLLEVALMARIPWLERRIGSWLATLHRGLGGYLIALLAAHTVFVVIGYSASLQAPPLLVVQEVFATYPGVLAATFAYLMLLGLGVSSIRSIRRRLGYERWHNLHLVAYAAVALAYQHEAFMGAQFTRNAIAKDTWAAMHIVVGAAVLLYRVVIPVRRTLRHRLRVIGVVAESADTISIYVGGVDLDRLGAQAGQYFRWRFLAGGLWHETHAFSLSAAPNHDCLRLTVKGVGKYTRRLKRRVRPGIRVVADGPYGAFTSVLRRKQRVLLVGGGVGVTPLRAIAETMDGGPGDIVFIQRASTEHDLLMADELVGMHDSGKISFLPVLGRRGKTPRHDPMSPNRLRELVPDLSEREVFICGSPAMAHAAIKNLRRAGVKWRNMHSELFDF